MLLEAVQTVEHHMVEQHCQRYVSPDMMMHRSAWALRFDPEVIEVSQFECDWWGRIVLPIVLKELPQPKTDQCHDSYTCLRNNSYLLFLLLITGSAPLSFLFFHWQLGLPKKKETSSGWWASIASHTNKDDFDHEANISLNFVFSKKMFSWKFTDEYIFPILSIQCPVVISKFVHILLRRTPSPKYKSN